MNAQTMRCAQVSDFEKLAYAFVEVCKDIQEQLASKEK